MTPTPGENTIPPANLTPTQDAAVFATLDAFSDWLEGDLLLLEQRLDDFCTHNSMRGSLAGQRHSEA